MITLPLAFVLLVVGLYLPIGICAYWYGFRCADRFWLGRWKERTISPQPVADYLTRGHHVALGMVREPKA